ncbi:hypothetical protein N7510_006671 [Penicillium lagena]|uniref:uncharacterized protein n=1 Tax=Penicillium lagena TaxID=94218 RepID=UPI0025412D4F|nr:uncharacterized protein N7510_006671 [Penicillium lagena]KAJ5609952.1 hypothetical protein N7510_006671 [Penicillium lagena]
MAQQDKTLPSYQAIPSVSGMPHGCTWGFWDSYSNGQPDELGTLNLLTPDRVLQAKEEVKLGISVAINWPLDKCSTPHSNRRKPELQIHPLPDWEGNDDEIHMNTQSGSQWDGFRGYLKCTAVSKEIYLRDDCLSGHWAHQPTGLYYNGVTTADIRDNRSNTRNGIDKWTERGGIVGRGILLDYLSWADSKGIHYSPVEYHEISVQDLEAVAKAQGTEIRPGDILLIRSGFVKWYNEASTKERVSGTAEGKAWAGVVGTQETVTWMWDHHLAAVGGDANAFEAWPAKDEIYRK